MVNNLTGVAPVAAAQGRAVRIYSPKDRDRYAFNWGNLDLQQYWARRVVQTLQTGLYPVQFGLAGAAHCLEKPKPG